jgi:hypothetical protein
MIDLEFVSDLRLRRLLEQYYAEAVAAKEVGSHLGAIVACGAVVEGLLTWALLERRDEAMKADRAHRSRDGDVLPIKQWNLNNLIDVAAGLGLLAELQKTRRGR